MYNHNKAQQSKNRVHISWDILYIRDSTVITTKQCQETPIVFSMEHYVLTIHINQIESVGNTIGEFNDTKKTTMWLFVIYYLIKTLPGYLHSELQRICQARWILTDSISAVMSSFTCIYMTYIYTYTYPDSKVYGANRGPTWGRQDPGGPQCWPREPCYLSIHRLMLDIKFSISKPMCTRAPHVLIFCSLITVNFTHILQSRCTDTWPILRLPRYQWRNAEG